MKFKTIIILLVLLTGMAPCAPFSQKLIYSDTPDIGGKWQFGLRMTDVIVWDLHWNINDWVLLDLLAAGFPGLNVEEGLEVKDVFQLLTLKSRPYKRLLWNGAYSLSGGAKIFSSQFEVTDTVSSESISSDDNSLVLFLTQGFQKGKHYGNFFTSVSFREREVSGGGTASTETIYAVPGYEYQLGDRWFLRTEYFLSNAERLPIRILQYGLDADHIEFQNLNRDWISFFFWGVSYVRKHIRIDLYMGNHISFQPPFIPVLGIGWDF